MTTETLTAAEYRKQASQPRRSKYRNRKTVVDGITFDSKREAAYYSELKLREKAGEVYEVELQRPFALTVNGKLICTYRSDFHFFDAIANRRRVVDTKGFVTPEFKLKAKLMQAVHGIEVEIVK